ncbi:MAG: hypothetical protein WA865_12230 [Spirulinaceae cyanobacterium]
MNNKGKRLEDYTIKCPGEVLIVTAKVAKKEDCIVIFKGFSSSLMYTTAFDPDVPLLPKEAEIMTIDRVHAPYNPEAMRYIQQGLGWQEMEGLLTAVGV